MRRSIDTWTNLLREMVQDAFLMTSKTRLVKA